MKKIIFFLLFISALDLYAQNPKIILGGDIQTSVSNHNAYTIGTQPRFSISGGVNLEYLLGEKTSFKTGLYITPDGFIDEQVFYNRTGNIEETIKYHTNLDYVSLPLLFSINNKTRFVYCNIGPYFSYLLNQSLKQSSSKNNFKKEKIGSYSMYRKIDFGLSLGAGINITLSNKLSLNIETKMNRGLINVDKNGPLITPSSLSKNISLRTLVGVRWKP